MSDQHVMTVLGPMSPGDLGITMTHEHLFMDMRYAYSPEETAQQPRELTIEDLGAARRDFATFPDVGALNDLDLTLKELGFFRDAGGRTVVDVTSRGFYSLDKGQAPDVHSLQQVARDLHINIVRGCGYYVDRSHDDWTRQASVEDLRDSLIEEIENGWRDSKVRPGVIGETGLSQPVTDQEWKTLQASCEAQKASGLPLYIHPHFGVQSRVAPDAVRFALRQGVDPQRINACHMDELEDLRLIRRVLDMGVYVSLDTFGLELYFDSLDFNHARHDSQRVALLLELLDLGYASQLLVSQDVCTKLQLRRYGGYGYAHFLTNIVPVLNRHGIGPEVETLCIENARRLLSIEG